MRPLRHTAPLDPVAQRTAALKAALWARDDLKARHGMTPAHRSVGRFSPTPRRVAGLLVLTALCYAVLLGGQDYLLSFWKLCLQFWSEQLDIPIDVTGPGSTVHALSVRWQASAPGPRTPNGMLPLVTGLLTLGAFAATYAMPDRMLPLKYLVRILCVVQGSAALFFLLAPEPFPYTIAEHVEALLSAGWTLMLSIPLMLAAGYYLLPMPMHSKVLNTVLILAYFSIAVPHLAVLHAWLLQQGSVLFMPLLFICFGALFDMLLFVALYAWAASNVPADLTA